MVVFIKRVGKSAMDWRMVKEKRSEACPTRDSVKVKPPVRPSVREMRRGLKPQVTDWETGLLLAQEAWELEMGLE